MTNPTSQVEECDREAVRRMERAYMDSLIGSDHDLLFAEHFAAHRHSAVAAAVAKREREIVADIAEYACVTNDAHVRNDMLLLIKKLQTGGGGVVKQ